MFGLKEIGLALDSRDCVVLRERSRGEIEELHHPALAQVRGDEIRAFGQRAYRLVGKSKDVVAVFPGRVEDPKILGAYLKRVVPRGSPVRRRLWASVPTGAGMQALYNLRHCLEASLRPRETVLVPELLAAAAGCGLAVLASEEGSQRARMVVHVGATQLAGGVFVDGALQGLVVRNGSWDQLVREVQENLKFRLGTTLGFNSYFKVVKSLARSFFDRSSSRAAAEKLVDNGAAAGAPAELATLSEGDLPAEPPEHTTPLNLRGFNERGLIEVVVEDETVSRTIDNQLRGLLFGLEKVIFGCFARLRSDGHGEIASDLLSDRVQICGDIFFDTAQLSQHFVRLSRFRFESTNGHAVARGLRCILAANAAQKQGFRELARSIQDDNRFLASAV